MLKCNSCSGPLIESDAHQLCAVITELSCPHCRVKGDIAWKPKRLHRTRRIHAIFDYYCQVYRDESGTPIENPGKNWDHSCPNCYGPAECISVSAHAEHHKCLECGHRFDVK